MVNRDSGTFAILLLLVLSTVLLSCDSFDPDAGERVPGLCVGRVNTCPSEVRPQGESSEVIVGAFNLPFYPDPDCRVISPNDRREKRACTIAKIRSFLDENIIYPQEAIDNMIEGQVVVDLTLSFPARCISDIEVSGDLGYGTACELKRVLTIMPPFESLVDYNTDVSYGYIFRYGFKL